MTEPFSLRGRVFVVTGGAGRIGRTFVRSIAQHGGIAVSADTDPEANRALIADAARNDLGDAIVGVTMDTTSRDSITSTIAHLEARYGHIHGLVNNAYPRNAKFGRAFEDVTYEDFAQNVATHLGGYFLASQQFARYFGNRREGVIVNMSSIYGVVAPRFGIYDVNPATMPVEYAAIKSAVIHFTKYLAQYLKGTGIRVNCISPGGIRADQSEGFIGRYRGFAAEKGLLDPPDLAGTLLFLLSDMSRYVNGQNIIVDDGWSL